MNKAKADIAEIGNDRFVIGYSAYKPITFPINSTSPFLSVSVK